MDDAQLSSRLADAFERLGLIDADRRQQAEGLMSERHLSFEMALYQVEAPHRAELTAVLEEVTGKSCLDPSLMHLAEEFVQVALVLLPERVLVATKAFPVQLDGNYLHLAMANPTRPGLMRRLEGLSGMRIQAHVSPERGVADVLEAHCAEAIRALRREGGQELEAVCDAVFEQRLSEPIDGAIDNALRTFARAHQDLGGDEESALQQVARDPATIVLVREILNRLVRSGASDIHFEPQEGALRIRPRIDGVLSTRWEWPGYAVRPMIARLKVMSGLDVKAGTEPLDSSIEYGVIYGKDVEFRVSVLPALHGEKAVLRVLDRSKGEVAFTELGFEPEVYEVARRNFEAPTGLVLVTGPTGSGKTTTLYSALEMINHDGVNVVTAEDPIESRIPGSTQVNCGDDGIRFADALRSFLRQDPDIIMVGEIRDEETATIALRAALTGHLVLSTLHTNDAASSIMRLTNMGLEPFLVGAALRMVIAQRLVRRLCADCRESVEVDEVTIGLMQEQRVEIPERVYSPAGCDRCRSTGYRGRMGLYEVLDVDERVERLIVQAAPPDEIRRAARDAGSRSLFGDGLLKVADGRTSLEEVHRVAAEG